jgi:hypothetical protein
MLAADMGPRKGFWSVCHFPGHLRLVQSSGWSPGRVLVGVCFNYHCGVDRNSTTLRLIDSRAQRLPSWQHLLGLLNHYIQLVNSSFDLLDHRNGTLYSPRMHAGCSWVWELLVRLCRSAASRC